MAALGEKPVKAFRGTWNSTNAPQRDDTEPMLVVDTKKQIRWYDQRH